jgi:hypothetical protein
MESGERGGNDLATLHKTAKTQCAKQERDGTSDDDSLQPAFYTLPPCIQGQRNHVEELADSKILNRKYPQRLRPQEEIRCDVD